MAKQKKKKRTPPRPQVASSQANRPATRPTPAKPTRQERLEAAQRERRRRQLVRRGLSVGAVLVVLGVIATVIVANRRAAARTIDRMEAGACEFDRRTDGDSGQGQNHVTGTPAYRIDPPAGGDHLASSASPGVYEDNVPPDGQLVHALEHGDIILWHKPDVPQDVVSGLREIANRYDRDVLVVPRASMTATVAATAWHKRLLCPGFEPGPMDRFVRSYKDKGPEKVDED